MSQKITLKNYARKISPAAIARAFGQYNILNIFFYVSRQSVVHSIDGVELIEFVTNQVFSTPKKDTKITLKLYHTTIHTIGRSFGRLLCII